MSSRNVTLSLPDDLFRKAKVLAAQRDTSVSALVAEALRQLTGSDSEYTLAWAAEERRMRDGVGLRVGDITWSREESHTR